MLLVFILLYFAKDFGISAGVVFEIVAVENAEYVAKRHH